jgi:hypothetical protein
MAGRKIWMLLAVSVALATSFMLWWSGRSARLRQDVTRYEATCESLSNSLATLEANLDWYRLQRYYIYREYEYDDQECWRLGCQLVTAEIAEKSNSLFRARSHLADIRTKLMVLEQAEPCAAVGASPRR